MFGRYFATEKALRCIPNDHRKFANLTKCLFIYKCQVKSQYSGVLHSQYQMPDNYQNVSHSRSTFDQKNHSIFFSLVQSKFEYFSLKMSKISEQPQSVASPQFLLL